MIDSCVPLLMSVALGRVPDAAGEAYWRSVEATHGTAVVARELTSSPEGASAGVAEWYVRALGRDADAPGLAWWSSIGRGDALHGIVTSAEAGVPCISIEFSIPMAIARTFPESPDLAVAVARCESSLRPDAIGDGGDSLGLMQVRWPSHARKLTDAGISRADLLTVEGNLRAARMVYDEAVRAGRWGWAPWSCAR